MRQDLPDRLNKNPPNSVDLPATKKVLGTMKTKQFPTLLMVYH